MTKQAEGGGFGSADHRSYTYWLALAAWIGLFAFVRQDLSNEGSGYLRTALGVESNFWVWMCMIGGWFAATIPNQQVAVLYTRYTGRIAYRDDRIGYAKSGGRDIAMWSGLFSLIAFLYVFTMWVPTGVLWWFRSFALLIATAVVGVMVARFIAKRVFFALYGPPRYALPR